MVWTGDRLLHHSVKHFIERLIQHVSPILTRWAAPIRVRIAGYHVLRLKMVENKSQSFENPLHSKLRRSGRFLNIDFVSDIYKRFFIIAILALVTVCNYLVVQVVDTLLARFLKL